MATRLTGWAAIAYAERHDAELSKHADDAGPARDGLDLDAARAVAARCPGSIYVDFDEPEPPCSGDVGMA